MPELWFGIITLMLGLYVVLDGYDLGAGAIHLGLARDDAERRTVLAAIGPYWDANEVWLIAAGGSLLVAFPRVMTAALSGFYLAIFLVVWCLILRAIAIELRSHLRDRLWRGFWDVVFALSSALLALLFGVALGNVIRGVPLTDDGWFRLTLFTTFLPRDPAGILDVYTLLAGVFSLVALAAHGAAFVAWRTTGELQERARRAALAGHVALLVLWPFATWATYAVNPALLRALPGRPLAWLAVLVAALGLAAALRFGARRRPLPAFLGSAAFLIGMLAATAACFYPVMLRAIPDASRSLLATDGGNTPHGMRIALNWWALGFPLVLVYFAILFRINRGKASVAPRS